MDNLGNKLQILYIHHGSKIGGAPISLLYLLRELDNSRYATTVLCIHKEMADLYKKNGFKAFHDSRLGIISHTTSGWNGISRAHIFIKELLRIVPTILVTYKYIKMLNPDLVHLNSLVLIPSAIAVKLRRTKLVWHIREPLADGYWGLRKMIISYLIKKLSDRIVTISPYEASKLGKDFKNNISVIYNFVDLDKFNPEHVPKGQFRDAFRLGKTPIVASLGGISHVKGTREIILAQRYVRNHDYTTVFVGPSWENKGKRTIREGIKIVMKKILRKKDYFHEIENILRSNNIDYNRIVFTGPRTDIATILNDIDVLIFAGTVPHFPRPIFEAWAMKKPVIAFDIDGVRQNVQDGVDGILVPLNDVRKLGYAIEYLINHKDKAEEMGVRGYAKALKYFDAKKNIKDICNVYKGLFV